MARTCLVALTFPLLLVSVSAADISGSWNMSFKASWTTIPDLVCALVQKGDRLEGTCKAGGDAKGVDLTDGRIEAERVGWTWKIPVPDGVTWTFAFAGTLDASGTAMNGVVTLTAGPGAKPNEATFAARKE
jgi:hypothetical protein